MGTFKTLAQKELLSKITLLLLVGSCFFIIGMQRSDISLALIAMINWNEVTVPGPNPCKLNYTMPQDMVGDHVWEVDVYTQILACYLYGMVFAYIPAEYFVEKMVAKWVVTVGLFLSSVCCFTAPIASKFGYLYLMLVQFLKAVGHTVVVTGMSLIMTKMVPSEERATFTVYAETAFPLGSFFTVLGSSITLSNGNWENIFYVGGSFGLIWLVLWIYMVSDYSFPTVLFYKSEPIPIKMPRKLPDWRFVTSLSVWGYLIASIAVYWAYAFNFLILPLFLHRVHGLGISVNSVVSSISHLLQAFLFLVTSYASEYLIRKGVVDTTAMRKTCLVTGLVVFGLGSAITMSQQCHMMVGCFTLTISLAATGVDRAVILLLPKNMSPNFADLLSSLADVLGFLVASFLPLLIAFLAKSQDGSHNWNNVFIVNTLLSIIAAILFLAFGSAKVQPWDEPPFKRYLRNIDGQRMVSNEARYDNIPVPIATTSSNP